jgi:demethylmenaquinone methyltransferase/2-methoxy-6-polyprenyl-1,4-benzoquinol methylase
MKIVPLVAKIFGSDPAAYKYLGKTIKEFPPPGKLVDLIASAGWREVSYHQLAGGIVALHRGIK